MSYAVRAWRSDGSSFTLGGLADLAEAKGDAAAAKSADDVHKVVIIETLPDADALVAWWHRSYGGKWRTGKVTA